MIRLTSLLTLLVCAMHAQITSPPANSTVNGSTVFVWNPVTDQHYWFSVSQQGCETNIAGGAVVDLVRKMVTTNSTSMGFELTVTSNIWVTLWYHPNGANGFTMACVQYIMQPPQSGAQQRIVAVSSLIPDVPNDQVDDDLENLATGQAVSQSSTMPANNPAAFAAARATDGVLDTEQYACTDYDKFPWWQTDLGTSKPIVEIELYSPMDTGAGQDVWVYVSDSPFLDWDTPDSLNSRPELAKFSMHLNPNTSQTIPVAALGRYVRVQLVGLGYLKLCEVRVMGVSGQ